MSHADSYRNWPKKAVLCPKFVGLYKGRATPIFGATSDAKSEKRELRKSHKMNIWWVFLHKMNESTDIKLLVAQNIQFNSNFHIYQKY